MNKKYSAVKQLILVGNYNVSGDYSSSTKLLEAKDGFHEHSSHYAKVVTPYRK